jgi:predicted deacylase
MVKMLKKKSPEVKKATKKLSNKFIIGGIEVKKGERKRINIDMGSIYDFTDVKMTMEVIKGKKDGPVLFVSSTIHGDEINGIEIIRRLLKQEYFTKLKNFSGTLIVIPIVNVFGFNDRSRYLPDRRDLNRCFPGTRGGSLASQLAYKFMKEVVRKSNYGIDLHTGSFNRFNYPQIRANLSDIKTLGLANAFAAPVMIDSNLRDGSLRESVSELAIPVILYEGGEALRFDEEVIQIGFRGIISVMKKIGMIKDTKPLDTASKKTAGKASVKANGKVFIAKSSHWIRAPKSGIHIACKKLGQLVKKGEILGEIANPFGDHKNFVKSNENGLLIGISKLPLANKGDALFHIATVNQSSKSESQINNYDNLEHIDLVNVISH